MPDFLVFVFILLALAVGFAIGRYQSRSVDADALPAAPWNQSRYLEGLTYLLKETPDEAIDRFITDMAVTPDTLEVHLSLGTMLRRKGELERAVRVHQNLLKRNELTSSQLQQVRLEISRDYIQSGLLDRAESLLLELADDRAASLQIRNQALVYLIHIYQDTKEWLKAIDIADQLTTHKFSGEADRWREVQAQYSCELAVAAIQNKDWLSVRSHIKNALQYDKNCVRASLLQAEIDMSDGRYPAALASLKKIPKQNAQFAGEMIEPMKKCFQALGDEPGFVKELKSYLDTFRDVRAVYMLFEGERELNGSTAALITLQRYLASYGNMSAARGLTDILLSDDVHQSVDRFTSIYHRLLNREPKYNCSSCGYEAEKLHWLCPSCKSWSTLTMDLGVQ